MKSWQWRRRQPPSQAGRVNPRVSRSANKRPIISHLNPKSPAAEAYRTLRTNLQFSSIDQQLRAIMVTSAGPGEGKSMMTANIAVTYAQAGQKVLLVDCDLRKPTVHHTFYCSNRWGLTNVLAGQCDAQEVIQATEVDHLYLVTAGPIPPNPAEMLLSNKMADLLESWKQSF